MRGAQNAVGKPVRLFGGPLVITHEPLPEILVQRTDARFKFLQRPGGELGIVFLVGLDAVKDGRLDVGNDKPVEIIENAAFDDVDSHAAVLFFRKMRRILLPEEEGHDHLVGLLVQLEQFHGPELVVPAPHVRTGENKLKKAFSYAPHGRFLTCLIFRFMANTFFRLFWQGNGGLVAAPKVRFAGSPLRVGRLRFPCTKEQM